MDTPPKETPTSGSNHTAGVNTHNTAGIVPENSMRSNAPPVLCGFDDGALLAVNMFEEFGESLGREERVLFVQSALMSIAYSTNPEQVAQGFAGVLETWLRPAPKYRAKR